MPSKEVAVDIPADVKRVIEEMDEEEEPEEGNETGIERGALEDIWLKAGEMDVDELTNYEDDERKRKSRVRLKKQKVKMERDDPTYFEPGDVRPQKVAVVKTEPVGVQGAVDPLGEHKTPRKAVDGETTKEPHACKSTKHVHVCKKHKRAAAAKLGEPATPRKRKTKAAMAIVKAATEGDPEEQIKLQHEWIKQILSDVKETNPPKGYVRFQPADKGYIGEFLKFMNGKQQRADGDEEEEPSNLAEALQGAIEAGRGKCGNITVERREISITSIEPAKKKDEAAVVRKPPQNIAPKPPVVINTADLKRVVFANAQKMKELMQNGGAARKVPVSIAPRNPTALRADRIIADLKARVGGAGGGGAKRAPPDLAHLGTTVVKKVVMPTGFRLPNGLRAAVKAEPESNDVLDAVGGLLELKKEKRQANERETVLLQLIKQEADEMTIKREQTPVTTRPEVKSQPADVSIVKLEPRCNGADNPKVIVQTIGPDNYRQSYAHTEPSTNQETATDLRVSPPRLLVPALGPQMSVEKVQDAEGAVSASSLDLRRGVDDRLYLMDATSGEARALQSAGKRKGTALVSALIDQKKVQIGLPVAGAQQPQIVILRKDNGETAILNRATKRPGPSVAVTRIVLPVKQRGATELQRVAAPAPTPRKRKSCADGRPRAVRPARRRKSEPVPSKPAPVLQAPVQGQTQPIKGQVQPMQGQTQPVQGRPVQVQVQLMQGQTQPMKEQTQPMQGQTQPMQGQTQPMKEQTQPVQGQTQPMQGQTQPVQGQTQPMQGQPQPMQGQTQPIKGQTQPVHGQTQPMQGQTQPMQGQTQPMQGQTQPIQDRTQPVEDRSTPISNQSQPTSNRLQPMSKQLQLLLERSIPTSNQSQPKPDRSPPTSNQSQPKPDRSQPVPDRTAPTGPPEVPARPSTPPGPPATPQRLPDTPPSHEDTLNSAIKTYRKPARAASVALQEALDSCVQSICLARDDRLTLYAPDSDAVAVVTECSIDYPGNNESLLPEPSFDSLDGECRAAEDGGSPRRVEPPSCRPHADVPEAERAGSAPPLLEYTIRGDGDGARKPKSRQIPGHLDDLLQSTPPDINTERAFNCFMSKHEPFCSLCSACATYKGCDRRAVTSNWKYTLPTSKPDTSPVWLAPHCFSRYTNTKAEAPNKFSNTLLTCYGCQVCVHAGCYGVTMLPFNREEWRCDKCRAGMYHASCCLCNLRGGALKRTTDARWAHLMCSLLLPGVSFKDSVCKEPINALAVKNINKGIECVYCGSRMGACVQCYHPSCKAWFHPTCGLASGVQLEVRSWSSDKRFNVLCHEHAHRHDKVCRVSVGQQVYVQHHNHRYCPATVVNIMEKMFYIVSFEDNTFSDHLYPEHVTSVSNPSDGPPALGSCVEITWTDGRKYTGHFQGTKNKVLYVVDFTDPNLSQLIVRQEDIRDASEFTLHGPT